MHKIIIQILSAFIPNKKKRKEFRKNCLFSPDWPSLYEQYLCMDLKRLYGMYKKKHLKSNILIDQNDWFYLTYLCLLLQKKYIKKAKKILTDYVSGINGLKHIEQFLPVANLAHQMGYTNERIQKAALVFQALENVRKENTFGKLIKDKTVAVIGNGPSEVGKGKGSEIDAHDIVIRMNNYTTEGYERDYGSKTDIWIRGWGGDDLLDYTSQKKYLFAGITGNYHFIPLYYDSQLDILYRDLIEQKIDTGYISCELYSRLRKKIDIHPSTGLAIIYIIQNLGCKKFDLYGFSFQQEKSDSYATHYFNDRDENEAKERSACHSFDKESEILKRIFYDKSL